MKGKDLEKEGKKVLSSLGLHVDWNLNDVELLDIDPDGMHQSGEHLEVDYLVPTSDTILVGEITGRSSKKETKSKIKRFKNHCRIIDSCSYDREFWGELGVSKEDVHMYLGVRNISPFFITTEHDRYDMSLPDIQRMVSFYKNDWETLKGYSSTIGKYAKRHFLEKFDILGVSGVRKKIEIGDNNELSAHEYRKISGNVDTSANIYRFEISPFEILPITRVERRDNLPSLEDHSGEDYQRPLRGGKIREIRKILKENRNFIFPNNILCVLSKDCNYNPDNNILSIPYEYGAITIIDGQHRLYSYASEELEELLNDPLIPVTSVDFKTDKYDDINTYSAHIFLEINSNQTRIEPKYLDPIAFDILGETDKEYLAAKVIKDVNECEGDKLYGMFDVNRKDSGFLETGSIKNMLQQITSLKKVKRASDIRSETNKKMKQGYENIFETEIENLKDADTLVDKAGIALRGFYGRVANKLRHDWPDKETPQTEQSTVLSLAKAHCGLIRLLRHFIESGSDWKDVDASIENMRENLMSLRDIDEYSEDSSPLLGKSSPKIPDSSTSPIGFFRFFRANISSPTSVQDIGD